MDAVPIGNFDNPALERDRMTCTDKGEEDKGYEVSHSQESRHSNI